MNCQEFWETLPELGPGPGPDEGRLGHLQECSACAEVWERHRRLAAGLRTAAAESRQWQAPARLESRLVFAFRNHAGVAAVSGVSRPLHVWLPVAAWAAAAVVLLGLAMFLVSGRQPSTPRRMAPARTEMAAVQGPADPDAGGDSQYGEEDFIPLPNAEAMSPSEDVNLVRVEVPRSAMIELGFAVSEERASEPVEAEVVLGADGLARAVRFLN